MLVCNLGPYYESLKSIQQFRCYGTYKDCQDFFTYLTDFEQYISLLKGLKIKETLTIKTLLFTYNYVSIRVLTQYDLYKFVINL